MLRASVPKISVVEQANWLDAGEKEKSPTPKSKAQAKAKAKTKAKTKATPKQKAAAKTKAAQAAPKASNKTIQKRPALADGRLRTAFGAAGIGTGTSRALTARSIEPELRPKRPAIAASVAAWYQSSVCVCMFSRLIHMYIYICIYMYIYIERARFMYEAQTVVGLMNRCRTPYQ